MHVVLDIVNDDGGQLLKKTTADIHLCKSPILSHVNDQLLSTPFCTGERIAYVPNSVHRQILIVGASVSWEQQMIFCNFSCLI